MKKNKTVVTEVTATTNPTKVKKNKSSNAPKPTAETKAVVVAKATKDTKEEATEREVKYIYSEGMSLRDKKQLRRNARAEARRFEKKLAELRAGKDKEALAKMEKEQAAFVKKTYRTAKA